MTNFRACNICRKMTVCELRGTFLWLCVTCTNAHRQAQRCTEYLHDYAGTEQAGSWVCLICGAILVSQDVNTIPVVVDTTQPVWIDCQRRSQPTFISFPFNICHTYSGLCHTKTLTGHGWMLPRKQIEALPSMVGESSWFDSKGWHRPLHTCLFISV